MTIAEAAREVAERGYGPPRAARDPVNRATVGNWLEALGDANPRYAAEGLAPPAMTQVWTMRGLRPPPESGDALSETTAILDEAGFTSVVATNCTQTYHRYLREGELVSVRSRLVEVTGPKRTSLGEGWFVTTESTWQVGDEPVATMLFRVLKFRPGAPPAAAPPEVLRPMGSPDTEFFWAGTARRELRVQRCGACGRLRHPPGPACPDCGAVPQPAPGPSDGAENPGPSGAVPQPAPGPSDGAENPGPSGAVLPGHVVAAGTGEIYSYVVHHHPPVPGHRLPFVIVLVELTEGVRMLGELLDAGPDEVRIGAPVRVEFVRVDDELTLPAWRLAAS